MRRPGGGDGNNCKNTGMADYWINRLAVHLDYLHLICGLAWLLFGCLGRFGMEGRNRRAGGWWQVAVLLLALEQWSRGFNESCGPGTNRELANFLLTLAPGFLLLEYAWQIFRAPGRWLPVRCIIYAGLLAMAGWLSLGASPGGMVFLQLAVIIPGALASLAMLPGAGGLPTREGRWLGLAAFGLVVFMVSVAGVDTFDRALFFAHPDSTARRCRSERAWPGRHRTRRWDPPGNPLGVARLVRRPAHWGGGRPARRPEPRR